MTDNVHNNRNIDRAKINVHESSEIAYWTRELGISEEKLVAAVMEAGVSVKSIRQHLGQ